MDHQSPDYKSFYPWASSDILGETSNFTTSASIITYRKSEYPKNNCLFCKEHDKFVKVVPCREHEPVCCDESSHPEGSFCFIYSTISKNFSFVLPSPVLREPFSLRSTSPLPSYNQIVGRLFGLFSFCATILAICPQWMYSFTSSKPKNQVRNCG